MPGWLQAALRSRRAGFGLIAAICVALLGYALVLQHVKGLEPCPLCILQRYAFFGVLLLALPGLADPRRLGTAACAGGLIIALAGAGVAAWHVHLQLDPPEYASCGPGLQTMITELPLARALPRIFQGSGECTTIDWTLFGVTMPGWSLAWLLVLALGFTLILLQGRRAALLKTAAPRPK